jgi:hypothetical protein
VLLQQTPSTQFPLWHSCPAPQPSPFTFFDRQVGAAQYATVGAQSESLAQLASQVVAPQANSPQLCVAAAWQVPWPLHAPGGVCVVPLHDSVPHAVVAP